MMVGCWVIVLICIDFTQMVSIIFSFFFVAYYILFLFLAKLLQPVLKTYLFVD